jgi:hypothetical protein
MHQFIMVGANHNWYLAWIAQDALDFLGQPYDLPKHLERFLSKFDPKK